MIPLAAPHKSVLFEYLNYNVRYSIFVCEGGIFISALAGPFPIIGVSGIDVNRHPETMHAVTVRSCNITPGKGASDVGKVLF